MADVDEELVDKAKLTAWLAVGGRRIGLGDWRPEKSGVFGRFDVEDVIELADDGAAAEPPRRSRRPASAGKRGRARRAGRPDKGRIATSDARVARVRLQGTVAWHGGAGPGMARRGLAGRGRDRFFDRESCRSRAFAG